MYAQRSKSFHSLSLTKKQIMHMKKERVQVNGLKKCCLVARREGDKIVFPLPPQKSKSYQFQSLHERNDFLTMNEVRITAERKKNYMLTVDQKFNFEPTATFYYVHSSFQEFRNSKAKHIFIDMWFSIGI